MISFHFSIASKEAETESSIYPFNMSLSPLSSAPLVVPPPSLPSLPFFRFFLCRRSCGRALSLQAPSPLPLLARSPRERRRYKRSLRIKLPLNTIRPPPHQHHLSLIKMADLWVREWVISVREGTNVKQYQVDK
ncbi:unnamed protein product [Trifolium pratense]|uniref:Uncharacterized protein n=1 Tax=Trifolium pratense TaxID=57577 RepID=A0ACB0MBA9_TRIPR|nr:unnamed protein product [Trifolium pratense]